MSTVRRLEKALKRRVLKSGIRVRRRAANTVIYGSECFPAFSRLIPSDIVRLARARRGREVTTFNGHYVVSLRTSSVNRWKLPADTADHVAAAMREAGLQFFAMNLPYARVTRWGVRRADLPQLAVALRETLGPAGFYYRVPNVKRERLLLHGIDAEHLNENSEIEIFRFLRCNTTGRLYGAPDGCRIAVWDTDESGRLISPDRDSVSQELDGSDQLELAERTRWDGRKEPILAVSQHEATAIEFPIDAVYLWVDDSDPEWRARRVAVQRKLGMKTGPELDAETVAAHRFRDRGELRASMRSLEMNAPWIRQIYLVTDDQRPDWLDPKSDRVRVIDHKEIFSDPSVLPSFNSHAIESQIHRIPGLADRYLLVNDDVMFNRPVTPYTFFTPTGQLNINFSRSRRPDISRAHQTTLESARANSAELLERDYERRASRLFGHVPFPQRKDIAWELEERYADEIRKTIEQPFRSETDVVVISWLHLYTALFTGRGVPAGIRYGYFNIGDPEARAKMEDLARVEKLQVICLNDVPPPGGADEADPEWLAEWLARMYPNSTEFELS